MAFPNCLAFIPAGNRNEIKLHMTTGNQPQDGGTYQFAQGFRVSLNKFSGGRLWRVFFRPKALEGGFLTLVGFSHSPGNDKKLKKTKKVDQNGFFHWGVSKSKRTGKKNGVLSRKERAEFEKKNGVLHEGGFKIIKKNRFFCASLERFV